jgi:hypothetical protein
MYQSNHNRNLSSQQQEESEYDRLRTPGWGPADLVTYDFGTPDPFRLPCRLRDLEVADLTSYTSPHAAYEEARYLPLKPEDAVTVHTQRGEVHVTKQQLLELASFPSEVLTDGKRWYSSVSVFPATEQALSDALKEHHEGAIVSRELTFQILKHCYHENDLFTIEGDQMPGSYSRNAIYSLLLAIPEERLVVRRRGDSLALEEIKSNLDIQSTDELKTAKLPEGAYIESSVKARNWPEATASVLTASGHVEISKEELILYTEYPEDITYLSGQWISTRRDGLLPTEESLFERLREYQNGERIDNLLASDWDKRYCNGEYHIGLFSTAHAYTPVKRNHPAVPDRPYVEFVVNRGRYR